MIDRCQVVRTIRTTALVLISAFAGSVLTGVAMAQQAQPNMVAARQSLRAAITSLNRATPDKGGHRDNAIGLAQQAIAQVNQGIGYANHH